MQFSALNRRFVWFVSVFVFSLHVASVPLSAQGQQAPAWQMKPPLLLDVAKITVENTYVSPGARPHVEHLLSKPLVDMIQQWVNQRLRTPSTMGTMAGTARRAVVTIEQASIVEMALPVSGGIKGFFKTDQSERYEATLRVRVAIIDESGQLASATAEAKRSRTVAEGTKDKERRDVWAQVANEALIDLDARMETEMRVYLGPFLR